MVEEAARGGGDGRGSECVIVGPGHELPGGEGGAAPFVRSFTKAMQTQSGALFVAETPSPRRLSSGQHSGQRSRRRSSNPPIQPTVIEESPLDVIRKPFEPGHRAAPPPPPPQLPSSHVYVQETPMRRASMGSRSAPRTFQTPKNVMSEERSRAQFSAAAKEVGAGPSRRTCCRWIGSAPRRHPPCSRRPLRPPSRCCRRAAATREFAAAAAARVGEPQSPLAAAPPPPPQQQPGCALAAQQRRRR